MSNVNPVTLSATYYWDHFQYVIRYLNKQYVSILSADEIQFLHDFQELSFQAQCLYLRLTGRRPQWFRLDKLKYQEIGDLEVPLLVLVNKDFIQYAEIASDDLVEILPVFTKSECVEIAKLVPDFPSFPSSIPRNELVQLLLYFEDRTSLIRILDLYISGLIKPLKTDLHAFCLFLFFGSRHRNMTDFVVRDLGHRQFVSVEEEDLVPYFSTRLEAIQKWKISVWREWFYSVKDNHSSVETILSFWEQEIGSMYENLTEKSVGLFEKSLFELGRWLERMNYLDEALLVYERSLMPGALERRVRILHKNKVLDTAIELARLGVALAVSPKEQHFFEDYLSKQGSNKHIKKVTSSLKNAELVGIPIAFQAHVERGVITYYQNLGYKAHFTENHVWKNLVGLLAWDLIFTVPKEKKDGFHHPFQWAPSHYSKDHFALGHLPEFRERLSILSNLKATKNRFEEVIQLNKGKLNPLVDWYSIDLDVILKIIECIPMDALKKVLIYFWSHLNSHAKGFPDLFIYSSNEYFFVEVKSPNDHLSAIQYFWHDFFKREEIAFKLVRVHWER